MKRVILPRRALTILGAFLALTASESKLLAQAMGKVPQPAKLQIALDLRDGSRLVGTPAIVALPLRTSVGKVDVPLKLVTTVEFADDQQSATVSCANGDVLRGVLQLNEISVATSFDKVFVPLKKIARITTQGGDNPFGLSGSAKKGLLIHYSFDRDEREKISDKSGNGRDGQVHGATWTGSGAIGGGMSFNGEDNYVEIPAKDLPIGDAPRSLATWMYQTDQSNRFYLLGYGGLETGQEFRISLNEFNPGQFSLETRFGGWHSRESLAAKHWYHLVVTYSGSGTPKFYLNGDESHASGTWMSPMLKATAEDGRIGTGGRYGGYFFKGKIDEVGVWDRALTSTEVEELFKQRAPETPNAAR